MKPELPLDKADPLTRKKSEPYKSLAPIYNHIMRHVDYSSWAVYLHSIINKINIETDLILDLGCGTGRFSEGLAEKFDATVIGIDPSAKMLERARAKNRDYRVQYYQGQADSIPLPGQSVDVILSR